MKTLIATALLAASVSTSAIADEKSNSNCASLYHYLGVTFDYNAELLAYSRQMGNKSKKATQYLESKYGPPGSDRSKLAVGLEWQMGGFIRDNVNKCDRILEKKKEKVENVFN